MSAINLVVTLHDVSEQYNLLMAGEATILGLTMAIVRGISVQILMECFAETAAVKNITEVLKVVGVARDTNEFVDAVKTGDPEEILVAALRLTVSVFTLKCQCFTGDTLVSTEDGDRRIDEIQAGDYAWAYSTENGERELKKVLSTPVIETDILVHVGLSDGTEIRTTMLHPFYVKTEDGGEWVAASNLTKGDEVLTEDGRVVYVENVQVEKLDKKIKVYNLEIEDLHTYFVAGGVLVHNVCDEAGSYSAKNKTKLHGQEKYVTEKGL